MAFSGNTAWEIRTDGSDTNGGGYDSAITGGQDYSQRSTPILTVTDAVCNGTTALTSVTGGFTTAMKGNILYLSSGPGWYRIDNVVSSNEITLDRNGPSASGMTCNVGGALASLGGLGNIWKNASTAERWQRVFVRGGEGAVYKFTTTTVNVSGGALDLTDAAVQMRTKAVIIKGYDPAYGRNSFDGIMPEINSNGLAPSSTHLLRLNGTSNNEHVCMFLKLKATAGNTHGLQGTNSSYTRAVRCSVVCQVSSGYRGFLSIRCFQCYAKNWVAGFYYCPAFFCFATDCGTYGFDFSTDCVFCIAKNCVTGFHNQMFANNCVAYGCTTGFHTETYGCLLLNSIVYNQSGYAFVQNESGTPTKGIIVNCASGVGGSGRLSGNFYLDENPISLTADPFLDPANNDFRLNGIAGGGKICRHAGISTVLDFDPPRFQTGCLDVGSVQYRGQSDYVLRYIN